VVKVRAAFSKNPEASGHKGHVDELIWEDREELKELFKAGARILVCGSAARLGKSTAEVCVKIYEEEHPELGKEGAEKWLTKMKEDRYVSDIFG